MSGLIRTGGRWFLGMVMSGGIWGAIGFATWAIAFSTNSAYAQITPDKTLPNNSSVTRDGNTFNINGGTQAGRNLFHSFQDFSVPTGFTASFNNAADIQNIFSRVTGGSISNIDGLISAKGTANLFLINPNEIIFGKNARLNIGGSFVGTTANAIQFGNFGFFSATNPEVPSPLLTINPSALLFNQIAAARIQNNSRLSVLDGKSLLLVGGEVTLDGGYLSAPSGRVELGGVAPAGTVGLNVDGNNLSLSFPDNVARADISLINRSGVDTQPKNIDIGNTNGTITINAGNLLAENSNLQSSLDQGGNININATGEILLNNTMLVAQGDGNISFQANSISLTNSSFFLGGYPKGGSISLQADDSISIAGSRLTTNGGVGGTGGEINIQARSVSLTDYTTVNAFAEYGNAGNININAFDSINIKSRSVVDTSSGDQGGNIKIKTGSFTLTDGGQVNATAAKAGDIDIIANSVTISGVSLSGPPLQNGISIGSSSGLFTNTQGLSIFSPSSQGGNIKIYTDSMHVSDGAVVSAESRSAGLGVSININTNDFELTDGGQILTSALSSGRAGDITVNATNSVTVSGSKPTFGNQLTISPSNPFVPFSPNSGLFANAIENSTGQGGGISITTLGQTTVQDRAQVTASSQGTGNAGDINITARSLKLDNGTITTTSLSGKGGNIDILQVQDLLLLRNHSQISTSSTGQGGNTDSFQVQDLLPLRNHSQIFVFNVGTAPNGVGNGGNITINAPNSGGNGGNITINAPNGFIIAAPSEKNDITANAFSGSGGKVQINATGIYGLTVFSREDLVKLFGNLSNIDFQQLPSSITAISQTSPNLNGQVNLNTPDVDPSRGLTQLPVNLVDASSQIDTSCNPGSKQRASSFTITGRGGLPPNPRTEPLTSDAVQVDWVSLKPSSSNHKSHTVTKKPTPTPEPIVQATGWTRNAKGEVVLTADASNATPPRPGQNSPSCYRSRNN